MERKIVTNTKEICDGFNLRHDRTKALLLEHKEIFEQYGSLPETRLSTDGRPVDAIELNDAQATLLTLLLGNTPEVVQFKLKITRELHL